nr:DHHW family protein [Lysinibacillus timonensis]
MKILNFLLPIAFIFALAGGLVLHFIIDDRELSEMENRTLQMATDIDPSVENVLNGDVTKKVESYISDQFPLRDVWMKAYVQTQAMTGTTYINDSYYVDYGSGWIVAKPVVEPKPKEELEEFADGFADIQAGLKASGIPMSFFTFPAKATYIREPGPSFMPEDTGKVNNRVLHEILTEKGIDNAILMESISEDVDVHDMYFKTDHHWNFYGAYQGYLALMKNIGERIGEEIEPVAYDEANNSCLPNEFSGSWNKQLYMTVNSDDQVCYNYPKNFETQFKIYKGPVEEGKEIEFNSIYGFARTFASDQSVSYATGYTSDYAELNIVNENAESDKHIVIVKDSYFNAIQFHVADHFKQVTVLDLRYVEGNPADVISALSPDHVFFVYNDRNYNVVEIY